MMHSHLHFVTHLFLTCVLLGVGSDFVRAGESVSLRLTSGRQIEGEISPRTSDERLWLVQRVGNAQLARPIAWDNIVAATFRDQPMTSRELRSLLASGVAPILASASLQQEAPQEPTPPRDTLENPFQEDPRPYEELPPPASEVRTTTTFVDRAEFLATTTPPVASVRFDAHLANWDADVEADGLVVQVVPVDRHGHIVPVRGVLQVELFGVRHIAFQDAPSKRGRRYERLGRWSQQLVGDYFDTDGGWFKLPFQAAQPEFDTRIGQSGLVHVKLIVPGAGVYESSLDGVRLRAFAPLRDALERDTGHRFFPTETTGLGKQSSSP